MQTMTKTLTEALEQQGKTRVRSDRIYPRPGGAEISIVLAWDDEVKQYIVWYFNHTGGFLAEGGYYRVDHASGESYDERKQNAEADAYADYFKRRRG